MENLTCIVKCKKKFFVAGWNSEDGVRLMYNVSHWPFAPEFWQGRVLWNRRKPIKKYSWYCARRVFRPVWLRNDIRREMENLYAPTELVRPQCSHTWEARCWQWVSLLMGRHGNLGGHKDRLCVRAVRACSAPQEFVICCTLWVLCAA